ncbi:RNA-editing complex protein MP81, putative [Trypanosoma cruzi marinkellei]|uniref:RNA-editing complex protein MP81, putative n=1 Tax=Trypanosoma cruzi marinkellei TaxID=85056 RepID=K2MV36_TRYCR|nr:RNA-editing complex protein MP81, putative [Trypanosoma cruzi marinkellei]
MAMAHSSHAVMILNNGPRSLRWVSTSSQTAGEAAASDSASCIPSSSAAGDDNSTVHADTSGARAVSPPSEAKELHFHENFLFEEVDVHFLLLEEAHKKHGVLLNVPPQMSPNGTPPEVPEVIFPAVQLERMRGMQLAYEPTHLPPPLHTTGTRKLIIDDTSPMVKVVTKTSIASTPTTTRGATSAKGGGGTAMLVRHLPPDPTMRFHCTACGKAFRLEFSAEQHVKLKHPSDSKAAVGVGPGEGEIIEEAVATTVTPTSPARTAGAETTSKTTGAEKGGPSASEHGAAGGVGTTESAKTQQATKDGGLSDAGVSTAKTPYNKATLVLPSEDLVDELLKEIWDSVAAHRDDIPKQNDPNAYVPFHTVVEGTADRRKEMEANAKPTARATPEGAAPGIKKPSMLSGGSMTAAGVQKPGMNVPIKELVKKYPNPFGDSPNAVLQELENEPTNPFIPQEELEAQLQVAQETPSLTSTPNGAANGISLGNKTKASTATASAASVTGTISGRVQDKLKDRLRASRPSLSRSASLRRFVCPLCAEEQRKKAETHDSNAIPSFRLLDALFDHVESAHEGEELSEEQIQSLYKTQRSSALHAPQPSANSGTGETSDSAGHPNTHASKDDDTIGMSEETIQDAVKAASLPEMLQKAAPPAAVEQKALHVHVRAGSNAVLLGRIADVQHGFIGTMAVTQYVLEIDGESTTSNTGDEGAKLSPESEKELIVVRCMGDNFPAALLKEQVRLGSTVLVQGTLRMNRHIDSESKRLHAYPFVQVVPPLGCVKVIG